MKTVAEEIKDVFFFFLRGEIKDVGVGLVTLKKYSQVTWSTSFRAVDETLQKVYNIGVHALPTKLYGPATVEDILGLFCIFEATGYHLGTSQYIDECRCVVWIGKMSIPSVNYSLRSGFYETAIYPHPAGEIV